MDVHVSDDPSLCKQPNQDDPTPSTPVNNDAPTPQVMIDHSMQEIPQPQPAVLHRSAVDLYPALQLHHNESGYSVLTNNSEVSILPMYTPPTPSAGPVVGPMSRSEVDTLRARYDEHYAQYLRHRRTYVVILVTIMHNWNN
jgi:hypothetical protein